MNVLRNTRAYRNATPRLVLAVESFTLPRPASYLVANLLEQRGEQREGKRERERESLSLRMGLSAILLVTPIS